MQVFEQMMRRSHEQVVFCNEESAGLRAIVTSRISGESIPRRILRRVQAEPALGEQLARDCGRALAAIHAIPSEPLAALPDLRDPRRYLEVGEVITTRIEGLGELRNVCVARA